MIEPISNLIETFAKYPDASAVFAIFILLFAFIVCSHGARVLCSAFDALGEYGHKECCCNCHDEEEDDEDTDS